MSKQKKQTPPPTPEKLSKWQIGLLLIIAGPVLNVLLSTTNPIEPPLTDADRGQMLVRGIVTILCIISGVVMIVWHFIQRKKN